MTPMDVARRMLRTNADPGLIAAYLALELRRDPTIGMTPMQRLGYVARRAGFALAAWQEPLVEALWAWGRARPVALRRVDYGAAAVTTKAPGGVR